jgi:hypothetical protein
MEHPKTPPAEASIPLNSKKAVQVVPKLVELLGALSAEERDRAVSAAMILLGHSRALESDLHNTTGPSKPRHSPDGDISAKADTWMTRNAIPREDLDELFSIDADGIHVIAAKMPGKSKRQQTIAAYVICGLSSFIAKGDPSFSDKDARALCQKIGCYDTPNHFNYVKGLGNFVSGSKEAGWKLTNPGLNRAAQIVRELAGIVPGQND